jgi:hypothetical protein
MAKTFNTNQTPATTAEGVYNLKQLMKAAGWSVKASGDGISAFSSSGDVITTGASGANGMANSRAWFRIQDPAGVREFIFQRGTTGNQTFWILYSALSKFTGGSPTFNTPSTAADQVNITGTTNAGASISTGVEGSMRFHCMAENSAPYTWYMFCYSNGGSTTKGLIAMDSLQAGSYNVLDADPIVVCYSTTGTDMFNVGGNVVFSQSSQLAGSAGMYCWFKLGLAGATWVNVGWARMTDGANAGIPGGLPTSNYSTKDEVFAPLLIRATSSTSPQGWKGAMSNFRLMGPQRALSGDTLNVVTSKDYIVLDKSIALPWDGSTPLN